MKMERRKKTELTKVESNRNATRQTYSQQQEQWLSLFFESPKDAEQRANKRKGPQEKGQCGKKRHSLRPENIDFDKDELLEKANTVRDRERVSKTLNKIQIKIRVKKVKPHLGLTNKLIK